MLNAKDVNFSRDEEPSRFQYDYKYASAEAVRQSTLEQLAKLELELHLMRMAYVVNGSNPDVMLAPNRKIGDEMARVQNALHLLEDHFAEVLAVKS